MFLNRVNGKCQIKGAKMLRIAKLGKLGCLIIACAVFITGCILSKSPQVKARQHLGLTSLRGIENIRYECDNSDKGFPAFYIQFDYTNETRLQQIINQLSLEESEFLFYAGSNPPVWWPDEIKDRRGDPEKGLLVGRTLRESGDIITYRLNQDIKDPSVNKAYLIEFFHYPKKKQAYYIKRWVRVAVPLQI